MTFSNDYEIIHAHFFQLLNSNSAAILKSHPLLYNTFNNQQQTSLKQLIQDVT